MERIPTTDQTVRKLAWETAIGTGSLMPHGAVVNSLLRATGCKR